MAGGHLSLARKFLFLVRRENISGRFLDQATKSGNLQIVKFIRDLLRKNYTYLVETGDLTQEESNTHFRFDLEISMAIAVGYKYLDIESGARELYDSLYEAAKNGDMTMINYLISLNPGLAGAAAGGNKEIVNFMINKGATDFTYGITSAAYGGHLDILEDLLSRGEIIADSALDKAVSNNQLAMVQYLLNKRSFQLSWHTINNSIIQDYGEIFSLLISHIGLDNEMVNVMMDLAIYGGRGKVLPIILNRFFPLVDSTMISRAGHHLNVVVQLINYQIGKAKQNAKGVLAPRLNLI